MMIFLLVCTVFITIVISHIWLERKIYKLSWKLPGPFAWPLIGNAAKLICKVEDIFDNLVEIINKHPSPFRFWLGPKCMFIFSDIQNVERIICSKKFTDKDKIYDCMKDVDGEGLISGSGAKWRKDRRLMGPLFVPKNITEYFPIMLNQSKRLVNILDVLVDKGPFPVDKYLNRCTADIINETILGVETDSHNGEQDEFLEGKGRVYEIIYTRMVRPWQQPKLLFRFCSTYNEHENVKNILHDFVRSAMQKAIRKSSLNSGNKAHCHSFMEKLLTIKESVPDFATEEEMVHHLSTLYTASEDTIMQISTYTLVLLGMYPNIQNRVAEEMDLVIGRRDVQLEDLNDLSYLDMCIKDVLRLFPIAPFIIRTPSEDVTIGDITLPRGCSIMLSIQSIHRDPLLWEKPNNFHPEHFSYEAVQKRNPYAFLGFSAGPRGCLGREYSYMALKTILATFLQHYEVQTDRKFEDIKLRSDISVRFKDNCYDIRIKKRLRRTPM